MKDSQKQTIAFLTQYFPPKPGAGSVRVDAFVRSLKSKCPYSEILVIGPAISEQRQGIVVHPNFDLPDNSRNFIVRFFLEFFEGLKICFWLLRKIRRVDKFIVTMPGYFSGLIVLLFLKMMKKTYFVDIRDIYPDVLVHSGLTKKDSFLEKILKKTNKVVFGGAKGVIAATQGIENILQRDYKLSNLHVVYNGFPEWCKNVEGEKFNNFTICFHGILGVFQDIDLLLEIAENVKSFADVIVIGHGRKESQLISSAPENLYYYGKLPFVETMQLVSKCHVGLSLRTNDPISVGSFPVKVFEYIGLGLPTLVVPPSEAGDYVEKNECGKAFRADESVLVINFVRDLKNDKSLYDFFKSNAVKARQELSRDEQAMNFAEIVCQQ